MQVAQKWNQHRMRGERPPSMQSTFRHCTLMGMGNNHHRAQLTHLALTNSHAHAASSAGGTGIRGSRVEMPTHTWNRHARMTSSHLHAHSPQLIRICVRGFSSLEYCATRNMLSRIAGAVPSCPFPTIVALADRVDMPPLSPWLGSVQQRRG